MGAGSIAPLNRCLNGDSGGYMISATDKAHLAITVAETAETTYLFLIKERNDEIAHGDTDNGCDEARQLEGVVDHIFANTLSLIHI